MKKITRLFAVILAFALAFSVLPAVQSQAAANPKLATASKILFVGGSSVYKKGKSEFVLKLKNKPKKYTCTWSVSDPDVANIEKLAGGKCKVRAMSVGTATVKCDMTDKKTGSKYSLETKVTVKKNTADLKITYSGSLDGLKPGSTLQLEGTLVDEAGEEYISIQPKDVTKTSSRYVSDVVRWVSSNSSVASVNDNGLVTMKSTGTAVITGYSIQAITGTYSKLTKATAKKTVTVTVKDEIKAVKQTALNKLQVEFSKDMSQLVTKDNLVITAKTTGINSSVSEVTFSTDGKTAYVTTVGSFPDAASYVVSYGDMSREFISSKGAVASIQIFTNEGNFAVSERNTPLQFRVFDANGVDITPLDKNSQDYFMLANKISYKLLTTGNYMLIGSSIYFTAVNQSAVVQGTYRDSIGAAEISSTAAITSVSEASLIKIEATTVIASGTTPKNIDFTKTAIVAQGDVGYRFVVKAKDADGNYIYSNASDSKFTFEATTTANNVFFIDGDGVITPLNSGASEIRIKYDNVVVSTATIVISEARKISSFKLTMDGTEIPSTIRISSIPQLDEAAIVVTAYDQYGDKIAMNTADVLNVAALGTGSAPYPTKTINTDGTVTVSVHGAGFGSSSGKNYSYQIGFANSAVTGFSIVVCEPVYTAQSTYKLVVTGDTDIAVPSVSGGLPKLELNLYEQKNGVNYAKHTNIYPSSYSTSIGQYFYEVTGPSTIPAASQATDFFMPYTLDNTTKVITKAAAGAYSVRVYQKTATSKALVASTAVTLTDSQAAPRIEINKTNTSVYSITASSTEIDQKNVLLDCAKITLDGATLGSESIKLGNVFCSTRALYIGYVVVNRSIAVGGTTYTIPYTLTVGTTFTSTY